MSYPRPPKRAYPKPYRSHPNSDSSRSGPSRPSHASSSSTTTQVPPIAYVQAYEAQLVYDRDELAREVVKRDSRRGMGLIRYAGEIEVEVEDDDSPEGGAEREIWADRHDILHLLPTVTLPTVISNPGQTSRSDSPGSPASSSSSWDSLPSDMEETFHLSDPEEIAAYEQEKKKRWIEALRQDRLREREKEDEEEDNNRQGTQAGYDKEEKPPEAILALMRHTAKAIFASPNPSVLEMRILTNHSNDERFSFLKGRYKDVWDKIKSDLKKEKEGERREKERSKGLDLGLGGLGGYDSDSDSDSGEGSGRSDGEEEVPKSPHSSPPPPPPPPEDGEDEGNVPPPPPPPEHDTQEDIGVFSSPPPLSTVTEDAEPSGIVSINAARVDQSSEQEEEKQRIRRLRMEEWKRKRAADKGTTI
ncbi:uncharacterized protein I303_104335 [Kwoniella dejecticola CBS 10117]|uniref:SURP motif domain-containing protein n=1 Tax=Kwoniella dejecticola CBS 10117 TaxID=1296121 RepID=A0A1A6A5M0_9TREE|nr:uncharacterized protein I303_04690 [Kwoniella dejecticola CBS 10117]OBR85355.1 hypothetical protein I303_04690 [Kwoniella dejecticola CBS 10117]